MTRLDVLVVVLLLALGALPTLAMRLLDRLDRAECDDNDQRTHGGEW